MIRTGAERGVPARRRTRAAATAVALAVHVILLGLMALGVDRSAAPRPAADVQLALVPLASPTRAARAVAPARAPAAAGPSPTSQAAASTSARAAPVAPAPSETPTEPGAATLTAPDRAAGGAAVVDGDALRAIGALFACHGGGGGLDPASRARCEAGRLRAARDAPRVDGVPAEKRATYDQVVAAYAKMHEGAPVALTPPLGARFSNLGVQERWVGAAGAHPPGVGCKVLLGRPRGWKSYHDAPPHSLKLGRLPCFITPPSGQFTEEADVAPTASLRERTDDDAHGARYAPPPRS